MINKYVIIIAAAILSVVKCDLVISQGSCQPKAGFPGTFDKMDQVAWYKFYDSYPPVGVKCCVGTFITMRNDTTYIQRHFINTTTNMLVYEKGSLQMNEATGSFLLNLPLYPPTAIYWLLDWTPKAAIIYFCLPAGNGMIAEGAFVMVSKLEFGNESAVKQRIVQILQQNNFNPKNLVPNNNNDCDKYVFPGIQQPQS